jgi:hypothetical protein
VAIWYIFSPFWYIVKRRIWQPWLRVQKQLALFTTCPPLLQQLKIEQLKATP